MTIKLHCFGESGHSYKVALALQICQLDWEPVFVDFFGGETRSAAYRAEVNEMGEAPVLVDGELRLSQSGAILQYLAERTGRLGGTGADRHEVLRWVLWDNHKLSGIAGMARFLANFLPSDKRPAPVIGFLEGRLRSALATLEAHLEGRDWIVGDAVSNADLSCCGYLYYTEPFGFERADWPQIDRWLGNISALDGWKHPYDLMPGNPADRA